MITRELDKRFQDGAVKYAEYLESPDGRLRTDLAFANLQEVLPSSRMSAMNVLDVGCGTGAIGVRLAQLGCRVTLLDSSLTMLSMARRATDNAGVAERIAIQQGDASKVVTLFPAASFDLVVCHNVLEFLEDPAAALCAISQALRGASAMLSIVVRNRAGEVIKAAIQSGDLESAEASLTAEWGFESLYGERVRLFAPDALQAMLQSASLEPFAERGLRVLSDYLPSSVSRVAQYEHILRLEKKLGSRPDFARVARYTHLLARRLKEHA